MEHQAGGSSSSRAQGQAKPVPDRLVGELARFACRSGSKGMDKVVTDFTAVHPEASKRQVEKKIQARTRTRAHPTDRQTDRQTGRHTHGRPTDERRKRKNGLVLCCDVVVRMMHVWRRGVGCEFSCGWVGVFMVAVAARCMPV